MKYRLKFTKLGNAKFIGHLDLIHIFQRAIKRASLPIAYSKGFNPHQLMSFAFPLSVGFESISEYADMEFNDFADIYSLNSELPEGIEVIDYALLGESAKNAMSEVHMAKYEAVVDIDLDIEILNMQLDKFLSQDEILVAKKAKKNIKEVNIRDDIKELTIYLRDRLVIVDMLVFAGSIRNLKPNFVIQSFYSFLNIPFNIYKIDFKRIEIYNANIKSLMSIT